MRIRCHAPSIRLLHVCLSSHARHLRLAVRFTHVPAQDLVSVLGRTGPCAHATAVSCTIALASVLASGRGVALFLVRTLCLAPTTHSPPLDSRRLFTHARLAHPFLLPHARRRFPSSFC
ncbi:hypothetical protein FRC08_016772 [Ceratobasidium sp. 394]|nr:hypothetical protein FRC08_016772 [Ceratobasidium sp. 394]